MRGLEIVDKDIEISGMEASLMCKMYTIESSSSIIEKVIEKIKRMIATIKRKIEKVISINNIDAKKKVIEKNLKKQKLLRFKPVQCYDIKKVMMLYQTAFNDMKRGSYDPDEIVDVLSDEIEKISEKKKTYYLGELVRDINIRNYVEFIDKIDEETDRLDHLYSKLMRDEENNIDEINDIVKTLKGFSCLTVILNKEISKELQLVEMILRYE